MHLLYLIGNLIRTHFSLTGCIPCNVGRQFHPHYTDQPYPSWIQHTTKVLLIRALSFIIFWHKFRPYMTPIEHKPDCFFPFLALFEQTSSISQWPYNNLLLKVQQKYKSVGVRIKPILFGCFRQRWHRVVFHNDTKRQLGRPLHGLPLFPGLGRESIAIVHVWGLFLQGNIACKIQHGANYYGKWCKQPMVSDGRNLKPYWKNKAGGRYRRKLPVARSSNKL